MKGILIDGQSVRAQSKSGKTIEGSIHTRSDGSRVVLQESGRWVKLANLRKVVATGENLYESEINAASEAAQSIYDSLDFDKIDRENKEAEIKDAVKQTIMQDEKSHITDEDAAGIVDKTYASQKALAKARDTGGGDSAKAAEMIDEYKSAAADAIKESLREHLTDALRDELGEGAVDELFDDEWEKPEDFESDDYEYDCDELAIEDEMTGDEIDEAEDRAEDFEDEDYNSISDDEMEEVSAQVGEMLDQSDDEIIEWITENYAVAREEAEDILLRSLRAKLDGEKPECGDEVDDAYCEEMDECEDEDGMIEHLKDTFEIPDGAMTEIIKESGGKAYLAIPMMAEYTRRQLRDQL